MVPATVVKSSAPTITGEPLIEPEPATMRVGRRSRPDERAELAERARVEQPLDARAGVELALAAVLVEPLRPAHALCVLTATVEIVERLPPVLGFRHACFIPVLPHGRFVVRLDEQGHILDCLL